MGLFDKLDRHTALVSGMSERVGVAWDAVLAAQPDSAYKYRTAVLTCTQCGDAAACKGWQAEHTEAENAPEYCLNSALFETLKTP